MSTSNKPVIVNLEIGDEITSISCGHIVVELIKFIVYQRLQIPYSYQWLKQVVNKKKSSADVNCVKESIQSERHFRTASTALENLDFIIKSLLQEISGQPLPEEVCIILGASPLTCKEVYRVLLPVVCHKPQCQSTNIANDQKIQRMVFRTLATSPKLSEIFFNQMTTTNMYVFLKKKMLNNQDNILNSDNFVFTTGCRIPASSKIVVINLRTKSLDKTACCNDFNIFCDIVNEDLQKLKLDKTDDLEHFNEIESEGDTKWYQSAYVMKGFKDCIVNGMSITNSWMNL